MKRGFSLLVVFLVTAIAAFLFWHRIHQRLPVALWASAFISPAADNVPQLIFHYNDLPRLAMACACGGILAFTGVITQQVLRNQLAEPMTLGIASSAYLALSLATVFYPAALVFGREAVAFAGAGIAMILVMLMAMRRGMSSLSLILAGMILNLCCGAVGIILTLLYYRQLNFLTLWGGGSLGQYDWQTVVSLLYHVMPCVGLSLLLSRPLAITAAGETTTRNLGISLPFIQASTLGLMLLMTAFIVSTTGVIGFIGLGAPVLARLSGARRLRDRLLWAPVIGMSLLWLADETARQLSGLGGMRVPTGAVTALLGVPIILFYLSRLPHSPFIGKLAEPVTTPANTTRPVIVFMISLMFLLVLIALFLMVGKDLAGWRIERLGDISAHLFLRAPQIIAAISVGILLAIAGGAIQCMTGNPMASPDLLGITSGGALGITAAIFLSQPSVGGAFIGCGAGCSVSLIALLLLGRRSSYAPDVLLLAGVSLTMLLQAVSTVVIASGDNRVMLLLNLLVGSTYGVTLNEAEIAAIIAVVMLAALPFLARWLNILPLGAAVAVGLGVNVTVARLSLLLFSALATAAATVIIGPLSFIGLIAPHITRRFGIHKPLPLLMVSAIQGAALMLLANWIGRWALFPRDIATGAIASLAGGLYLLAAMLKRTARTRL